MQIPGTPQLAEAQLMVAPLLAGKQVSDMMPIWRSGRRDPFTPAHLAFLVGLAQQAAIAMEARLETDH